MKSGGFTLVEIIVALALFAMAVVGLAIALSGAVDASIVSRRDSELRQQMASRIDEASVLPLATLEQGVEAEPDPMGVTYSMKAERTDEFRNISDEELTDLWWVTVRAEWTEGREKQEWEERFLRYGQQ